MVIEEEAKTLGNGPLASQDEKAVDHGQRNRSEAVKAAREAQQSSGTVVARSHQLLLSFLFSVVLPLVYV